MKPIQKSTNDNFSYSGVALILDERSALTGRIYEKLSAHRAVENFKKLLKETQILGRIDHPENASLPNLLEASHIIEDVNIKNNAGNLELIVNFKTLPTENGLLIKSLYQSNVNLFISLQGFGIVDDKGWVSELEIITFNVIHKKEDVLNNPSVSRSATNGD